MVENWLYIKYFKVALAGSFKFIAGILAGLTGTPERRLSIFETVSFTTLGMMLTVVLVSIIGEKLLLRKAEKEKSKPQEKPIKINWKKRLITRVKTRWGLFGIAALTPVLFSPPLGTLLAVSIGAPHFKIFTSMFISAVVWGILLSVMADELVHVFEFFFNKKG